MSAVYSKEKDRTILASCPPPLFIANWTVKLVVCLKYVNVKEEAGGDLRLASQPVGALSCRCLPQQNRNGRRRGVVANDSN